MKKAIAAVAVVAMLGIPSTSYADTAKTKSQINQEYKAALDKWKADNQAAMNTFKSAMSDYLAKAKANAAARKSANDAFKSALEAARTTYKSAIAAATTAEAKTAAENARKAAVAAATAADRGHRVRADLREPGAVALRPRPAGLQLVVHGRRVVRRVPPRPRARTS